MSMTKDEVMTALEGMGSAQTRKIFMNHGAPEGYFGVKVGDMKTLVKKIKKNHELSLELYETGNGDAMYMAGLIADEKQITKEDLQRWAEQAPWYMVSEYTVAWIAAESPHGWELAEEWIATDNELIETAGWNTLSSIVSLRDPDATEFERLSELLDFIGENIHNAKNRVRYCMNGLVISIGGYVPDLSDKAIETAKKIGKVNVEMGGTACKVPDAVPYIDKMLKRGVKKRKQARC